MLRVVFVQILACCLPFLVFFSYQFVRRWQGKPVQALPFWPLLITGGLFAIISIFVLVLVTTEHAGGRELSAAIETLADSRLI